MQKSNNVFYGLLGAIAASAGLRSSYRLRTPKRYIKPHQGKQECARRAEQMANGHQLNSHKPSYQRNYYHPRKAV